MAQTKKIMGAVAAIALVLTTVLTFAFKAENNTDREIVNPETNKSVKEKAATIGKARLVSVTFYHIGDSYTKDLPSGGTSCQEDDGYCTITFTGEPENLPSDDFLENAIPTGTFTRDNGTAERSWQEP